MGMLNVEPGPVEPADALPDPATHLQARDSLSSASDGTGDASAATLEAVRGLLAPEFQDVDDATITRFVKATGGHLPLSVKRLQATLTWRRDTKPELVVCRACLQDAKSHYMHLVGYDKQDRPIIYSCLALAKNKTTMTTWFKHLRWQSSAWVLRDGRCQPQACQGFPGHQRYTLCKQLGGGAVLGGLVWQQYCSLTTKTHLRHIYDHLATRAASWCLVPCLQECCAYLLCLQPERLGLFMVVDAPSLFTLLWNAISSWVDPKTHQKIKFLPYDATSSKSKLVTAMAEVVDPVTLGWLQREMAENRDKATAKTKAYDMSSMHRCASSGQLLTTPRGDSGHDHRGSPALLSAYASSPTLLEPQATSKLE
ncbi:CRAL-TRIO domain-containing protein [Haematococcus lacustris]|uniref:CRAL-TRIO domain-containing protein n=1 Tax=Haematococcus lacustris TaxID=44745 RepID=A0A6A0A9L0_HAELA|nr:CRAL-TRIO domain-containing protein [Haematococcus lacustris]